jgi:AcrR family transcriptional regulator
MRTRQRPQHPDEELDGRIQRSLRSRQRILDAMVELVEEGELQPTGQQVADRAGVGLRSVFRHFEDMETLYAELRERVERELRPQLEGAPIEGTLEERIQGFARARSRIFERIAMFQRSERIQRWHSPVLQDSHTQFLKEQRAGLLGALPEVAEAPAELRQVLEVATAFEFWDLLRTDQGLGAARAEDTLCETLRVLLRAGDSA